MTAAGARSFLKRAVAHAIVDVFSDSMAPGSFGIKEFQVLASGRYLITLNTDGLDASSLNRLVTELTTIVSKDSNARGRYMTTGQVGQLLLDAVPTGSDGSSPNDAGEYTPGISVSGAGGNQAQPVGPFTYMRVGRVVHVQGAIVCVGGAGGVPAQVSITAPLGAAVSDAAFSLLSGALVDDRAGGTNDALPTRDCVLSLSAPHLAAGVLSSMPVDNRWSVSFQYELPKSSAIVQPVGNAVIHFLTVSLISGISGD